MSTERILQKLRIFSHSDGATQNAKLTARAHMYLARGHTTLRPCSRSDSHVRAYLNSADSPASLKQKTDHLIHSCTHLFTPGRHGLKVEMRPYDNKLPSLAGWPRNSVAP